MTKNEFSINLIFSMEVSIHRGRVGFGIDGEFVGSVQVPGGKIRVNHCELSGAITTNDLDGFVINSPGEFEVSILYDKYRGHQLSLMIHEWSKYKREANEIFTALQDAILVLGV